jgi:TolB-like protein/thioredoxin-like negative regulator of GroEL
LDGRSIELKEYSIATEVFGRPFDFDARTSSIVRTQMGKLRQRLAEVYSRASGDGEIEIVIEKGNYIPRFVTRQERRQDEAAPTPRIRDGRRPALVILPFRISPPDSALDELSYYITSELGVLFEDSGEFLVISRSWSESLAAESLDIRTLCASLEADYVFEGTMYRDGDGLRVVASLTEAGTGRRIGAASLRFPREGSIVAEAAAAGLTAQLTAALAQLRGQNAVHRYQDATKVYRLWAEGSHILGRVVPSRLGAAMRCFEAALREEGRFAPAWASLSLARLLRLSWRGRMTAEVRCEIKTAATLAVALDRSWPSSMAGLGAAYALCDWNWDAAAECFAEANACSAAGAAARVLRATLYDLPTGQTASTIESLSSAMRTEPLNVAALFARAQTHYQHRALESAADDLCLALRLEPGSDPARFSLIRTCLAAGDLKRAEAAARPAGEATLDEPTRFAAESLLSAFRGDSIEESTLNRLRDDADAPLGAYIAAVILTRLGRTSDALRTLECALATRSPFLFWATRDPLLDATASLPGFECIRYELQPRHR